MLRTKSLFVFLVLFGFGTNTYAAGGAGINRGGLGFLFPDNNSFVNPGQFADSHGMAVEGFYSRSNLTGAGHSISPSFVYGNGMMGVGVYGTRTGTDLLGAGNTDTVGAGLGVALLKGRATLGVRYDKTLGMTDNGVASATVTLNPAQRKGVAIGVGYTRNITSTASSLVAGAGYSFMSNNNLEVNITFPDINTLSNWNLAAYVTTMKGIGFLGAGYVMAKAATTSHGVSGRLGVVLGRSVDVSVWGATYFVTGSPILYGGSLRASF